MAHTGYSLPEWLGGHAVVSVKDIDETYVSISIETPDEHGTLLHLARRHLVEVKAPSIDDPAPWPLVIVNEGRWLVRLRPPTLMPGAAHLDLETPEANPARGVLLSPAELRLLARAAWQRANAVEGGAS